MLIVLCESLCFISPGSDVDNASTSKVFGFVLSSVLFHFGVLMNHDYDNLYRALRNPNQVPCSLFDYE